MDERTPAEGSEPRRYWDAAAAAFDDEPDHGLRDPLVLRAWTELLRAWLPGTRNSALDIGCGTGSLTAILAELAGSVTGVDFSREMVVRAQAKTAALSNRPLFCIMDASQPAFAPGRFDVVVCRHVLWALPEREQILARWAELLRPGGRLLLIEGNWSTGAGIRADELISELPRSVSLVSIQMLSARTELWGKQVTDERYAVVADRSATPGA